MPRSKRSFERCVVVVNPASTNYARGQRLIKQLSSLFPKDKFEVIELGISDYDRPSWLITRLNASIGRKTLLAIAGGDGTNNLIIDLLLRSSAISEIARKAVVLPLWAGNANDLAHMANGGPPSVIKLIIEHGTATRVYPLAVYTRRANRTSVRLAVCYVSLGASAYASARMSSPSHRRRRVYRVPGMRILSEMASVTRAFIGAATFESSINGQQRRIYDIVMINGSRMAKVNRFPVKITDKNFHEILVVRKHPLIVSYFVQIIRGIAVERRTHTERTLIVNEPTWAQIDGEALQIPSDTHVTVRHYTKSFYLLQTKFPAQS